jgi:hypothetical protein
MRRLEMKHSIELLSKAYQESKAKVKEYEQSGDWRSARAEREYRNDYKQTIKILRGIDRFILLTSIESRENADEKN